MAAVLCDWPRPPRALRLRDDGVWRLRGEGLPSRGAGAIARRLWSYIASIRTTGRFLLLETTPSRRALRPTRVHLQQKVALHQRILSSCTNDPVSVKARSTDFKRMKRTPLFFFSFRVCQLRHCWAQTLASARHRCASGELAPFSVSEAARGCDSGQASSLAEQRRSIGPCGCWR